MQKFPLARVCQIIEPGPIILVSTKAGPEADPNVMTLGFHMMVRHHPPYIAITLGPWDYSYQTLKKTKQCVIAVPGVNLGEKVVDIGNCSGKDVDKFHKYGLTSVEASKVGAPLIAECIANLECRVVDTTLSSKHFLFVLQVVAAWVDQDLPEQRTMHHLCDAKFTVDSDDVLDYSVQNTKWQGLLDDDDDDDGDEEDAQF